MADLYTQHQQFTKVKEALSRAEGAYTQSLTALKEEFALTSLEDVEKEIISLTDQENALGPQLAATVKEWESLTDWKAV
jgi:DNA-binding transcriptional LysR family regulator